MHYLCIALIHTFMVAHQYQIREQKKNTEILNFNPNQALLHETSIRLIDKPTATPIILEYEWLKSMPYIVKYCFGIYFNIENQEYLGGVLIFSNDYADNTGVWDKYGFENKMLLLSRGVCLWWTPKNSASFFINKACKWLIENTEYRIFTATVDPSAGEIGTIYQALNWKYVGLMSGNYHNNSESKRFSVLIDGKLRYSRWIRNKLGTMKKEEILKVYPDAIFILQYRKRRYFCFMDTKINNIKYLEAIKHLILPYPKRDNIIYGIIYQIKNKINNKIYIGQTIRSFNDRIKDYKSGLGNDYLNNAFNKYGWENFEFKIIDTANNFNELNEKEIKYIFELKSNNKDYGYNLESGGKNSSPNIETLEKMSKSHLGIVQSDKWIKNRIAIAGSEDAKKYGKLKTDEEKLEISKNSPRFWQGKTRDEETKQKISKTKIENGLSIKQKKMFYKTVYKINRINAEIVTYESTRHASEVENVDQSTISRWCLKDKIINEFIWSYKNIDAFDLDNINNKLIDEKMKPKQPRIVSQETREKLSIARSKIKQSQEWIDKRIETVAKPVIKIHNENNIILERFKSLADAGRENKDGLSVQAIERKCNGTSKNDDEYAWYYEEDFLNNTIKQYIPMDNKKLEDFTEKELMNIYYEYKNNNVSIRSLSKEYSINFLTLNTYFQKLEKPISNEFDYSKQYTLTCKITNKKFDDYVNKSGALTRHIQETYPNIVLESKFKRKQIEMKTGKPWYFDYFYFNEI